MTPNIPPWQRTLQRFLALRPVSAVLARFLYHADAALLRFSGGRLDFARLSGLPVIEITTIGAKSGMLRTLPLAGLPIGKKYVLIASNFGRAHHPAWYHNLKANPECIVRAGNEVKKYIARETQGQERERYWNLAVSYYIGYESYQQRAGERVIPVLLLKPKD